MLQKNIYILYPPGYSGSYVNWAISVSDQDMAETTVKDPINGNSNETFGGNGTSHKHVRIPTHQGNGYHFAWVMRNRELSNNPRIYVINAGDEETYWSIWQIAAYDPDGVFIHIHNDANPLINSFGIINCVTKWPTYIAASLGDPLVGHGPGIVHPDYDPFDCANDRLFRNWAVKDKDNFFRRNNPFDHELMQQWVGRYDRTYATRHKYQPHEVNETMYLPNMDLTNRIFSVSCFDICSPKFAQWLDEFMSVSQVSDNYDCSHVGAFHQTYIDAQPNLQWFDSIRRWELLGEVDDYLMSHSIIQAQVIAMILKFSGIKSLTETTRDTWISAYTRLRGSEWPELNQDEYSYWDLPDWVRKELEDMGYKTIIDTPVNQEILALDWENLDLKEINAVYQNTKF
jgi:hypothetical protein